jgi:DNA polymerase elongation subunit (family B)
MKKPRIIIFDLETIPNMPEAMKVWPQLSNYPGLTLRATITSIICGGWKVLGEKKIHCINAWDYPEWKKDINNDKRVTKAIYDVLKDADQVITHNGKRFDWKFLQTRLMKHRLPLLHKIKHVDTCSEAKSNLFAFNNRLGTISKLAADTDKLDNGGWDLWVDVSLRKAKAMKLMTKYCKQDVKVTEDVYMALRPVIGSALNYNLFSDKPVCHACNGKNVRSDGRRYTKTAVFERYRCRDCGSCGSYNKKGLNGRAL